MHCAVNFTTTVFPTLIAHAKDAIKPEKKQEGVLLSCVTVKCDFRILCDRFDLGKVYADWEFTSDFVWDKLANKRAEFTFEFASDPNTPPTICVYAVVFAAPRYLCAWITAARANWCSGWPMLDLVNKAHSPFTRCRQYLRSIVSCENPRLLLVAMFAGFTSTGDFLNSDHPCNILLRNAVLATESWLWHRAKEY